MPIVIDGSNGITQAGEFNSDSSFGFKNRIINGACVIDQRNAGASVTPSVDSFTVDRFKYEASQASKFTIQQNAGSVTPPAGFSNYLGFTVASAVTIGSSDYFQNVQVIEGLNIADLGWGTANAKTVTLSFWVHSSLTGTFGGSLRNSAVNRSYPFSYTISSANTWEQKTITIAGDTSGTWLTTSGVGIRLTFGLGNGSTYSGTAGSWSGNNYQNATGATSVVGTNGATFYITGVQLEVGSTATSFDYRPYTTEVQLCQRYYCKNSNIDVVPTNGASYQLTGGFMTTTTSAYTTNGAYIPWIPFPVIMRVVPTTVTFINVNLPTSPTSGNWSVYNGSAWVNTVVGTQAATATGMGLSLTSNIFTTNQAYPVYGAWNASAEL